MKLSGTPLLSTLDTNQRPAERSVVMFYKTLSTISNEGNSTLSVTCVLMLIYLSRSNILLKVSSVST